MAQINKRLPFTHRGGLDGATLFEPSLTSSAGTGLQRLDRSLRERLLFELNIYSSEMGSGGIKHVELLMGNLKVLSGSRIAANPRAYFISPNLCEQFRRAV